MKTNSDPRCAKPAGCEAKSDGMCRSCACRSQQRTNVASKATRAKQAAALKLVTGTPEYRAAKSAANGEFLRQMAQTPWRRAQQSANLKATLARPVMQARMGWLTEEEKARIADDITAGELTYGKIAELRQVSRRTVENVAKAKGVQRCGSRQQVAA